MKLTARIVLPLLFCGLPGPALADQVLVPDFSGPTLDASWLPVLPPGFSHTVGGGELRIVFDHAGGTPHEGSGGLAWALGVEGDYVVRATVDVSGLVDTAPGATFMNGGAYVFAPVGAAFVGPWRSGAGAMVNGSVFLPGYESGAPVAFPTTSIDIMIERSGGTVTESAAAAGSGAYVVLYTSSDAALSGPASVYLNLFHSGSEPVAGASIAYSQVSVTLPAVPEPAAPALLAAGLALLAWRGRARRG